MKYTAFSDNINIYLKEIRKNDSLTREEEVLLFTRIAKGDKDAETEVFNRMAKLAVSIAKTYTPDSSELLQDLIQEANLGILTAIKKYDLALGYRFSSYARFWMKASISTFLAKMGTVHAASPRILSLAKKIKEKFYAKNQREISEYELLDILEEMGEVVTDLSAILSISVASINTLTTDDLTLEDSDEFASATASDNVQEDIENQGIQYEIARKLSTLTYREQILVKLRFGFIYGSEMDFKSVAETWNNRFRGTEKTLTQERCRQIVQEAVKKMR